MTDDASRFAIRDWRRMAPLHRRPDLGQMGLDPDQIRLQFRHAGTTEKDRTGVKGTWKKASSKG
jgi:hypothetical protein